MNEAPLMDEHRGDAIDGHAPAVTVAGLDELVKNIALKIEEIEKASEVTKNLNKELARMEGQAVHYLKDLNREDYDSPFGQVEIKNKWSVKMPKDALEKKKLWDWMREKGVFDHYATVDSSSLNALYKEEWAEAEKVGEGFTFCIPGIGAPNLFQDLKFKPRKK